MARFTSPRSLFLGFFLVATATAQFKTWQENQINTTICSWKEPRVAIIRDVVYLNGGNMFWSPGFSDGSYGLPVPDYSDKGLVLRYNLSYSFGPQTNLTDLLVRSMLSYAPGGATDSSSTLTTFSDGAALYNNASLYFYGGLPLFAATALAIPDEDEVIAYAAYSYNGDKLSPSVGFKDTKIDAGNVSTYVTFGGSANSFSENKAWYFSGLQSPDGGPIYQNPANRSSNATAVTDSFVTLDFSGQTGQSWTNTTLPSSIKGRANPSVVWVPVGEQGILVVIGGVTYPGWTNYADDYNSPNPTASKKESPVFMQTLDIYDVAGNKWYKQETESGPGTRTRGCAVLATASDKSSFNIYFYGGFDGLTESHEFYDEVWVLSMPSFVWVRLNEGKTLHGRSGHKCFTPYPDQMMVFGGYASVIGNSQACPEGGMIVNFNMSSGEWIDGYDPTKWSDYSVPTAVQKVIGGDDKGGAKVKEPAKGWAKGLDNVFGTSYDDRKLQNFYPFQPAPTETAKPGPSSGSSGGGDDGGLPSWVAPFLGTILGLIFLTSVVVLVFLFKKRKIFKPRITEDGTEDTGYRRIWNWVKDTGNHTTAKSYTAETIVEEGPASPEIRQFRTPEVDYTYIADPPQPVHHHHEIGDGTQRFEMEASTPANELPDIPLSPSDIVERHSTVSRKRLPHSISDPSNSSLSNAFGDLSSVSHASASGVLSQPPGSGRVDSPAPSSIDNRMNLEATGQAQRETSHIRNISDPSLIGSLGLGRERPALTSRTTSDIQEHLESHLESPISPPTATESQARDYLEAQTVSPVRRSVFHEHDNDSQK